MSDRTRWPGRWFLVSWTSTTELEEPLLALAFDESACGALSKPAGPGRIAIDAWFDTAEAAAAAIDRVRHLALDASHPEPVPVEDDGWLEASMGPRPPIHAGRFVIWDGRSERPRLDATAVLVTLAPSRAFGTGEHATTRLCLEVLSDVGARGRRVLDLGAGSALLAIAAAKDGALSVVALEIDPAVIDVALENVRDNAASASVAVVCGSWQALSPDARFDLVLANIHKSALVRAARAVAGRLSPGGYAVLSGFGVDDAIEVQAAWEAAGCALVLSRDRAGWAVLGVQKHAS